MPHRCASCCFSLWPPRRCPATATATSPWRPRAGDFVVAAEIRPDPPAEKGNTLQLRLTDARGAPVEGAGVQVDYLMPAMGAMSEMRGKGG